MKGKRYYSFIENLIQLNRKKLIIIFFFVSLIILLVFICVQNTGIVQAEANEKIQTAIQIDEVKEISKIEDKKYIGPIRAIILPDDPIEEIVSEEVSEEIVDEKESSEKEEKVVTYKGKEVSIPIVEKAPVNDSEDQHQNSSTAGTATQTTVEDAKNVVNNNSSSDGTYEHISNSVGIDVSKWNGTIDWAKVKNAGIDFAMIRVGYRGSTQGSIMEDPYFQKNVNGAIKNGVKVGIYFFSMARTEEEAIQEAAWVVSAIKKYSITYPVAYDLESWGTGRIADVSYTQLTNNAIAFLGYIRSSGYTPMMYASKNDFNNRWQKSRITGCKYWLAHYTKKTDYTGSYQMWQYSSKGSVPGINGDVDMNIAYFSYNNTEAPKHICDFKFEKVLKEATCTEEGQELYRCECGDSKKETVPATGHSFGEWKITKSPTEDLEGEKTRICEKCHVEEKETIEKLPKTSTNNTTNTINDSNSNLSNNTTNTANNGNSTTNTVIDNTLSQNNDNSNTLNNTSPDNTNNETNSVDNSINTTNTPNEEPKNEVENVVNITENTTNTSANDTNTVNENNVVGN